MKHRIHRFLVKVYDLLVNRSTRYALPITLLLAHCSLRAQVRVPGTLTNGGNPYPTETFDMVAGGPQIVADMAGISNTPSWLRRDGMLFHVMSPASDWRYVGGTNNANLVEVVSSGGGGGSTDPRLVSTTLTMTAASNNFVAPYFLGSASWTNLVNVPAGFADGTDDGSGGSGTSIAQVNAIIRTNAVGKSEPGAKPLRFDPAKLHTVGLGNSLTADPAGYFYDLTNFPQFQGTIMHTNIAGGGDSLTSAAGGATQFLAGVWNQLPTSCTNGTNVILIDWYGYIDSFGSGASGSTTAEKLSIFNSTRDYLYGMAKARGYTVVVLEVVPSEGGTFKSMIAMNNYAILSTNIDVVVPLSRIFGNNSNSVYFNPADRVHLLPTAQRIVAHKVNESIQTASKPGLFTMGPYGGGEVLFVDPITGREFATLLTNSYFMLSDQGGVQFDMGLRPEGSKLIQNSWETMSLRIGESEKLGLNSYSAFADSFSVNARGAITSGTAHGLIFDDRLGSTNDSWIGIEDGNQIGIFYKGASGALGQTGAGFHDFYLGDTSFLRIALNGGASNIVFGAPLYGHGGGLTNISWNNLVDVPAGFADGTDDGSGGGAGTFNFASLTNKPPPILSVSTNYAGSLTNYSWNNLVDVPAGFADGTDDGAGGGSLGPVRTNQFTTNAVGAAIVGSVRFGGNVILTNATAGVSNQFNIDGTSSQSGRATNAGLTTLGRTSLSDGSVSAPSLTFSLSDGACGWFTGNWAQWWWTAAGGTVDFALLSGQVRGRNTTQFGWGSGDANSSMDTSLYRNAAGVVEINNGTAGTFADLKLRRFLSTNDIGFPLATNTPFSNSFYRATSATTAQWTRDGSGFTNIASGGGSGTFDFASLTNKPPPILMLSTNDASTQTNIAFAGFSLATKIAITNAGAGGGSFDLAAYHAFTGSNYFANTTAFGSEIFDSDQVQRLNFLAGAAFEARAEDNSVVLSGNAAAGETALKSPTTSAASIVLSEAGTITFTGDTTFSGLTVGTITTETLEVDTLNAANFFPTNFATFSSIASVAIASTGWTNIWSTNNAVVEFNGTAVSAWKKRAGALTSTNIAYAAVTGSRTVILKPGQAIVISGTGVAGSADPL